LRMRKNKSRGFTLLEVLIAIVLIGFAFLSTASLHIRSLRDTKQSSQVVMAAQLAEDLSARLRASSPLELGALLGSTGASTTTCFTAAGCLPAEMAKDEIEKWKDTIPTRLLGARGTVCRDSALATGSLTDDNCTGNAADPIVIKVWWPLRSDSTTAKYEQYFIPFVAKP
jgi:type IV pilus assembly protein PilV